jgi:ABC-type uncharacterized transport system substrate-binding protein
MMRTRFWPGALIAVSVWLTASAARAHPHVWVTMMTELLYSPDSSATAVREAWTFDDMYSAFATTGIQAKTKGQFTRDELAPLAQENVESLKDFDYFTYAKIDGKRQKDVFNVPIDNWLNYDPKETVLTLHFTLPFKEPVKTKQLTLEIYDPAFFIDFGFAEKNPVRLIGAPPQCTVTNDKPSDSNFPVTFQRLNKSFVPSEANIGMGMNFANKISVTCP